MQWGVTALLEGSWRHGLAAITVLDSFARNQKGAIAIVFALSLFPMVGAIGSAVDYSFTSRVKARLDAAADMAALAGVKIGATVPTPAAGRLEALNFFNANADQMARATINSVNVTVSDNGLTRTAIVTYTATVQTSFMGLMGFSSMQVGGTARANSTLPTYIDFYLLLDNSPSMGLVRHLPMSQLWSGTPRIAADLRATISPARMTIITNSPNVSA